MTNSTGVSVLERPKEHRENRKKARGRKVDHNQANAIAKFVRVPPRKARLVMDAVRGQYVFDAMATLRFVPNRAADFIAKVLASAVANGVNNHGLSADRLKIVDARVDEGPRLKRVQPRAQGRAYRILKRMSHISIIVEEVEPKPRKPRQVTKARPRPAAAIVRPGAVASAANTEPEVLTEAVPVETAPEVQETTVGTESTTTETAAIVTSGEGDAVNNDNAEKGE